MTEPKSPLTTLVEFMLFAPLGAALLLREQFPQFAVTGRERLESRVRVAKMVGEFAVKTGKQELERRLAGRTTPTAQASAPTTDPVVQTEATEVAEASTTATGRPHLEMNEPAVAVADLAIPGYDSLAASQVVERLGSLAPDELDAVRRYELVGRHRRTILNRIDQLVA